MTDATREVEAAAARWRRRARDRAPAALRQGLSLGAPHPADRLRRHRHQRRAVGAQRHLVLERPRPGRAVQSRRLMPTYPESAAVKDSLERLFHTGPHSEDRRRELQAQSLRPDRQPPAVDAPGALRAAAAVAGHAPCLRRGLEHDRQMDRRAVPHLPAHRRRHDREICRVRMRRRLLLLDRHGSALHPQTLLTFKISDEILAPKYGYPPRCASPPSSASRIRNGSPRSM